MEVGITNQLLEVKDGSLILDHQDDSNIHLSSSMENQEVPILVKTNKVSSMINSDGLSTKTQTSIESADTQKTNNPYYWVGYFYS